MHYLHIAWGNSGWIKFIFHSPSVLRYNSSTYLQFPYSHRRRKYSARSARAGTKLFLSPFVRNRWVLTWCGGTKKVGVEEGHIWYHHLPPSSSTHHSISHHVPPLVNDDVVSAVPLYLKDAWGSTFLPYCWEGHCQKDFSSVRMAEHWNKLTREVVKFPSLEIVKIFLDAFLCNLL